jgi:hypothetical protein
MAVGLFENRRQGQGFANGEKGVRCGFPRDKTRSSRGSQINGLKETLAICKPANLLSPATNQILITDFGFACWTRIIRVVPSDWRIFDIWSVSALPFPADSVRVSRAVDQDRQFWSSRQRSG